MKRQKPKLEIFVLRTTNCNLWMQAHLVEAQKFVSSFDRPNIHYTVVQKDNARHQLRDMLRKHKGEAGIVYCLSRKRVEQFADYLAEHNADPKPFAWVADADSILDRIKKVCERTSDSGH